MASTCCVSTCANHSGFSDASTRSFRFPNDENKRAAWMDAIISARAQLTTFSPNSRICELHFTEDDIYFAQAECHVKADAVPSVFASTDSATSSPKREPNADDYVYVYVVQEESDEGENAGQAKTEEHAADFAELDAATPESGDACPHCANVEATTQLLTSKIQAAEMKLRQKQFELKQLQNLQKHMENCSEPLASARMRQCGVCTDQFPATALLTHICQKGARRIACEYCQLPFESTHSLQLHLAIFHEDAERKSCAFCAQEFQMFALFQVHVKKVHTEQNKVTYISTGNGVDENASLSDTEGVSRCRKTANIGWKSRPKDYECILCRLLFPHSSMRQLREHLERQHPTESSSSN